MRALQLQCGASRLHHRAPPPQRTARGPQPLQRNNAEPLLVLLPPSRCSHRSPATQEVDASESSELHTHAQEQGAQQQQQQQQQQELPTPQYLEREEQQQGPPSRLPTTARSDSPQQRGAPQQQRRLEAGALPSRTYTSFFRQQPGEEPRAYVRRVWARLSARMAQRWSKLEPKTLGVSILFVLGVILVNYGVESMLDFYLGESPVGSIGCILTGAGVLTYLRLMRVPVARALLQVFLN